MEKNLRYNVIALFCNRDTLFVSWTTSGKNNAIAIEIILIQFYTNWIEKFRISPLVNCWVLTNKIEVVDMICLLSATSWYRNRWYDHFVVEQICLLLLFFFSIGYIKVCNIIVKNVFPMPALLYAYKINKCLTNILYDRLKDWFGLND